MIRAITYARVSGDDRDKDGRNLAGQLDMCREYAQNKGYQVIDEITEDEQGASGALFDLPGLNRALTRARAGEYEVLIVRELDRFSRKLAKQLIVEEELRRAGVSIEYVLGDYQDSPEGRLMKNVRATIAEYEREKIRERIMRGRRLKVKAGSVLIPRGQAPYGYKVVKNKNLWALEINEDEADVIRMMFTWFTGGDGSGGPLTIYKITEKLSEMGVPTYADIRANRKKINGYGKWGRSSVTNILKNETYAGVWHYGKKPSGDNPNNKRGRITQSKEQCLAVKVPAIISRDVWEIAQKRFAYNVEHSPRNSKNKYLLGRRVKCGSCGLKMGGRTTRDNRYDSKPLSYYCCPSTNKFATVRQCSAPLFRADYLDALAWEWVKALIMDRETLEEGLRIYQDTQFNDNAPYLERIKVIDRLLAENRDKLERLIDLYLSGAVAKEMLLDRQKRLENNIAVLTVERRDLAVQLDKRTLTSKEITTIGELAERVAIGLMMVDGENDHKVKKSIIEALDVTASVVSQGEKRIADLKCILAETTLLFTGKPIPEIVLFAALQTRSV
jgi:site-specific DNA recombinase